jgi:hypothetical protein
LRVVFFYKRYSKNQCDYAYKCKYRIINVLENKF